MERNGGCRNVNPTARDSLVNYTSESAALVELNMNRLSHLAGNHFPSNPLIF